MGIVHQLKLLLWKNFTLKKRSPFVVVFEQFIPLVLFVILLLIRQKQPAEAWGSSYYSAKPLPSAGVMSIMQAFCDRGVWDTHGFVNFPNSSAEKFLSQFRSVAKDNNFFVPGFSPTDMDELPSVYRSIIDNFASIHDKFKSAKEFNLSYVLTNVSKIEEFLINNLSLTIPEADAFLHSSVDTHEVYRLLFGMEIDGANTSVRKKRSFHDLVGQHYIIKTDSAENLKHFDHLLNKQDMLLGNTSSHKLSGFGKGLLYEILRSKNLKKNEMLLDVVLNLLDVRRNGDNAIRIGPQQVSELLKMVLLLPDVMHQVSCSDKELSHLLIPDLSYNHSDLVNAQHKLCKVKGKELKALSDLLKAEISNQKIIEILHLNEMNFTSVENNVREFLIKMEKFYMFQNNLYELSILASSLPQNACDHISLGTSGPTTSSSFNFTAFNLSEPAYTSGDTKPTILPRLPKHNNKGHYAGLLQIWTSMQKTICGHDTNIPQDRWENDIRDMNLDDLGLSSTQQHNIGILIHVLYSNPKVLYAPSNTSADSVIKQANKTFAWLDRISEYAEKWLNVSQELRQYLSRNQTADHLLSIKEIQEHLKSNDQLAPLIHKDPRIDKFLNITSFDPQFFLHEIDSIDNAACSWLSLLSGISLNVFQGFPNEEQLVNYVINQAYNDNVSVFASVVFENMDEDGSLPSHIRYKIRQNASFTWTTKFVRSRYWYPGPGPSSYPYYQFGFVWIQDMIERAIIDTQVGRDVIEPGSYIHQFPHPCYVHDRFVFMIEHVMPLCLTISWVYTVAMLVQSIVYEKEQRLKEVMKMMGLNNAVHWCAWFTTTFIQMTITMGILTGVLKYGKVLTHSDPWIIFIVLEVFAIATIAFSFLVSVLYSKAKLAAACAGIMYFLTYVPYMYIVIKEEAAGDRVSSVTKSFASLFSTTAFGLGAKYFAFYEEEGVGVHWNNMYSSPVEDDEYNLFLATLMMVLDSLIYGVLVWYIENVHPGSYGLPKPWYFPFTRAYWCGMTKPDVDQCVGLIGLCKRKNGILSVMEEDQACAMEQQGAEYSQCFELEPSHLTLGVRIDNLTKVYKTGKKVAVKNLSLNLFENQITSFLGHNGAGKTTTMSILTGLFPPTSGYATVYDHDIRSDMDVIRKSLGMCPQHNVLFDKLTVEEHLWFYGRLKDMRTEEIKEEMETMIQDVGLPKKRHSTVDCLSGGMQRKLSVAIAFVGGSRTVILDEPTAGVDPYSRRAIWDLLVKYKHGRTILLSTHHMDEADILGDRIAIISEGQLKCCGSPLFLKNTFGEGYHLNLVKKEAEELPTTEALNQFPSTKSRESFTTDCVESTVTRFIQTHVSTAYLRAQTNRELHYILPFEEAKKGNFEKLFQALEVSLPQLKISSFGVMDTSLEEVFLKVTEWSQTEGQDGEEDNKPSDLDSASPVSYGYSQGIDEESRICSDQSTLDANSLSSILDGSGNHSSDGRKNNPNVVELGSMTGERRGSMQSEASQDSVRVNNRNGQYTRLQDHSDGGSSSSDSSLLRTLQDGRGSYTMSGHWLCLNQFRAVIIKRFYYIRRNWKGLFTQILLPALFVCIAMTVALSAPGMDDLPPLELSPSQYFNLTQPRGNFIPYANENSSPHAQNYLKDAGPHKIISTFHLPSGVGATCVLKSPFNSSFDVDILKEMNYTAKNFKLLSRYFESSCEQVFVRGLPLENFVPPAATLMSHEQKSMHEGSGAAKTPLFYPICSCTKDGSGFICPENDGHLDPPNLKVVTSDIVQDITGQNVERFYLYTTDEYRLHRYGGLSFGLVRKFVPKDFGESAPANFRKLAVRNVAQVWFNHKGFHAIPVYLNTLNNALLRANLPKERGNPAAYGITVINHPMNHTNNKLSMDYILQGSDVLIAIFIIVAMSFVPASFVLFLVYERSIKAKHLQFISGIDPLIYWVANYIWDMCNYVIPAFCCIGILLIFDIPSYVSPTNLPAVVSLFLLYGWSVTPVMYPASFLFREPSTAYICLIVINLFVGITCVVCSFLLEIFSYDKDLLQIHHLLKNIFLLFPNYCLGRGLMDIAFNQYRNVFYFKTGQYYSMRSPFEWDLTAKNLAAMAGMGLVFFVITLLCEYRFFIKSRQRGVFHKMNSDEDVDVATERRRVLSGSGRNEVLCLENLTKMYVTRKLGKHLAVDHLCLAVPAGEYQHNFGDLGSLSTSFDGLEHAATKCFGLLGVNGAGKTTTFKMLTGDITPTDGDACLNRYSILSEMTKVHKNIGYCPQFDSLYDELTAREHLQLYSRLRGVPPKDEKQVVNWALQKLALTQYADKPSGTYSGGNKRKLSTAIALIGHPPVIFMDEPTTGMDPHSRRFLWDLILDLIKNGRSVILTSHSMEECEALCTRLAIMVNGRFKCLGSTQHLKNKYGDGYTINIRVKGPDYDRTLQAAKHYVERHIPEAKLKEQHYNMLQFEMRSEDVALGYIFGKLENAQRDLDVADYSVSQNTLDNVFINFVKQQSEIVQEMAEEEQLMSSNDKTRNCQAAVSNVGEEALETEQDDISVTFDRPGTRLALLNMEISNC